MLSLKIIFWISVGLILYSYFGYAIIITLFNALGRSLAPSSFAITNDFEPDVTLLIAAYNEAECIELKIENCLRMNYPSDKTKIIIITDGSNDESVNIIKRFPTIRLLHQPTRLGKTAAINRAMEYVQTPIVIFSDANTLLNSDAVTKIVRHYSDPKVGAVAGEKKLSMMPDDTVSSVGEGTYWKYESWLKRTDSKFYSVIGAAGELFSIRTSLFEPISNDIILDDFIISTSIIIHGFRCIYEPEAFATELPSLNLKEEQKRKIRIGAGAFQALGIIGSKINPLKFPRAAILYFSHRVARWVVCPACLITAFCLNIIIVSASDSKFYLIALVSQIVFYLFAILGFLFQFKGMRYKVFYLPQYFVFMNINTTRGFVHFLKKKQTVKWDRSLRKQLA